MRQPAGRVWQNRKKCLVVVFGLVLGMGLPRLDAQVDFDRELNFNEIREMFSKAYAPPRDKRQEAEAWYCWALYDEQKGGNRDSVFTYFDKSARLYLEVGDTLQYHRVRTVIADRMAGRYLTDEALRIENEALAFFQRAGNLGLETQVLAGLYRTWLLKGDTVEANRWKTVFLEKNAVVKDTVLDVRVMMEQVYSYQKERRFSDAAQLSFYALGRAVPTRRQSLIAEVQYNLGYLSRYAGKSATALFYLHEAERSCRTGDYGLRRNIYRQLAQTYEVVDSFRTAYHYAMRSGELGDTILIQDRSAARARAALQFDAAKKLREIESLEHEKEIVQTSVRQQQKVALSIGALLLVLLLASILVVFGFRQRLRSNRVIAAQHAELDQRKIRELQGNLKISTMQSMLEGQESERQRIAHDLHDSLGGLLAAAKIHLENLPVKTPELAANTDWQKLKNLLNDTVAEARHIAHNLLPGALLRFGLATAIQDLTARVRGEGVPKITFQYFGEFSDLSQLVALNCYRIVQELLQNSLKHARATEILLQLTRTDTEIALLVEDDGQGFDLANAPKGMGTQNVAQRVQFLHGEMSVQTAPGEGTSVHVTVPLPATQGFPG